MSTDAMYNAESRYLHQRFLIHFSSEPLEVLTSNYLISSSTLEDTYKSNDSPFGEVTSNELSLSLYDDNGLFNPANKQGAYYGLIKRGIKIESFIRPDETEEWDPLGVFFVNDWSTSPSGLSADITANDVLYSILNGSVPTLPVYRNKLLSEFLIEYFALFKCTVEVDKSIDRIIPYIYTGEYSTNKAFLSDLMLGAMADCFCDHRGVVRVVGKNTKAGIRATLTDSDQIINVSVKHTILTNYDSAVVTYHVGQESKEDLLVSAAEIPLEVGANNTGKIAFSKYPVLAIKSIKVTGDEAAKPLSYVSNDREFEITIQSNAASPIKLDIVGTTLEFIANILGSAMDAPLKLSSKFMQDKASATTVYEYAKAYVESNTPYLELTVRGNPKLQLGDIIEVNSSYYKTQYTGTIVSAIYDYQGSLSCKLKLAMLGGT